MIITPVMFCSGGFKTFFFFLNFLYFTAQSVDRWSVSLAADVLIGSTPQTSELPEASQRVHTSADRINHRSVKTRRGILISCKLLISLKNVEKCVLMHT